MDARLAAFVAVAALLTITPGADTVLVLKNSIRGGRRDGFATMTGICSGLFVHATFSALGLSLLLTRSAALYEGLKYLGAIYLIYLGVASLRGVSGSLDPIEGGAEESSPEQWWGSFREGFLTNVLNPKVAVFYLAFLPQFIGPEDHVLGRSLLLAAIHFAMGVIWLGGVAVVIDRSRLLLSSDRFRRGIEAISGLVLIGFGLALVREQS